MRRSRHLIFIIELSANDTCKLTRPSDRCLRSLSGCHFHVGRSPIFTEFLRIFNHFYQSLGYFRYFYAFLPIFPTCITVYLYLYNLLQILTNFYEFSQVFRNFSEFL